MSKLDFYTDGTSIRFVPEDARIRTDKVSDAIIRTDSVPEKDPNGKDLHSVGAKGDAGKLMVSVVLQGFARALLEVSKIGDFGAKKYTKNGWVEVEDGPRRYADARLRHWLKRSIGEEIDPDSKMLHLAHEAWNILAELDLFIREREKSSMS